MAWTAMADESPKRAKHVSIRKGAEDSGIAAELLNLLETVTADGAISESEASELQQWLNLNRNADLPAIPFLLRTIELILADGRLTVEERRAPYQAAERVLPAELRQQARDRRIATEIVEKAWNVSEPGQFIPRTSWSRG